MRGSMPGRSSRRCSTIREQVSSPPALAIQNQFVIGEREPGEAEGLLRAGADRLAVPVGAPDDEGHVLALAHHSGLAERNGEILLRHVAGDAVQPAMLKEDNRVVVLDTGGQQALGIMSGGRHHDLEAGDVREQRFEALRMLRPLAPATPDHHAYRQRHAMGAAGDVVALRRGVEQLLERQEREVDALTMMPSPSPLSRQQASRQPG